MRVVLHLSILLLSIAGIAIDSVSLSAQTRGENTTRQRAFELFNQDKHLEALPLFEELALKSPDDRDVLLGLGACLVDESSTLDDENAATKERIRARQVLLKAKKLGSTAPLKQPPLVMPHAVNEHNAKLEPPLQRHREEALTSSQNRDTLTENL